MTRDPHLLPLSPQSSQTFFFQRKNERLDWRKIASLDIDKLIGDGDTSLLSDYKSPILFCNAESEFDSDKTDPGFIKVFKLCQLLGEYFSHCYKHEREKATACQKLCKELEMDRNKIKEELEQLRENLGGTKKELKRTKELLATTQAQALGSENQDEIDQCPYCNKRFLTPFYLHAHIQRRHQGLPFVNFAPPPQQILSATAFSPLKMVPNNNINNAPPTAVYAFTTMNTNNNNIDNNANGSEETQNNNIFLHQSHSQLCNKDSSTQTISVNANPTPTSSEGEFIPIPKISETQTASTTGAEGLDLKAICELVEKYLEEKKSVPSQNEYYDKILKSISYSTTEPNVIEKISDEDIDKLRKDEHGEGIQRIERDVTRMKEEFEGQWSQLSQKIRDSGIEELREAFLTEIKKVQEMILNTPKREICQIPSSKESNDSQSQDFSKLTTLQEKVQEGDKSGKEEEKVTTKTKTAIEVEQLEKLETELHAKMRLELDELKARLEKQDSYWRATLEEIEQKHHSHIQQLHAQEKKLEEGESQKVIPEILSLDNPNSSSSVTMLMKPVVKPRLTSVKATTSAASSDSNQNQAPIVIKEVQLKKPNVKEVQAFKTWDGHGDGQMSMSQASSLEEEEDADGEYLTILRSEYEEPIRSKNNNNKEKYRKEQVFEEVSDYTLSSQPEEDDDDEEEEKEGKRKKVVGQDKTKFLATPPSSPPPKTKFSHNNNTKYVFDQTQGRIMEATETKSQMDLVRDRMVLGEIENKVTDLGIDPQATTIGMEEMSRALKLLKIQRRQVEIGSEHGPEKFDEELKGLRENVKYEVAKRSIHQKLEQGRKVPENELSSGPFSKILKKMKNSGSSWKQKVTSAMRGNKRKDESAEEMKTTFFSKWGKKNNNNNNKGSNSAATPTTTMPQVSKGEDKSISSSSVDGELSHSHLMTKSQPILKGRGGGGGRRRPLTTTSDSSSSQDEVTATPNKPPRRRPPPQPQKQRKESEEERQLRGRLLAELKSKVRKLDSPSLSTPAQRKRKSNSPSPYRGPNFLVKEDKARGYHSDSETEGDSLSFNAVRKATSLEIHNRKRTNGRGEQASSPVGRPYPHSSDTSVWEEKLWETEEEEEIPQDNVSKYREEEEESYSSFSNYNPQREGQQPLPKPRQRKENDEEAVVVIKERKYQQPPITKVPTKKSTNNSWDSD